MLLSTCSRCGETYRDGYHACPHDDIQIEIARLDGGTNAELQLILHLLTTPRRVGTANSDINAMRYVKVHETLQKHGEALRAELRAMGWRV